MGRRAAVSGFLLVALWVAGPGAAGADEARERAPWLEVPAGWSWSLQGKVVAVMPDDLPPGRRYLLLVEPPGSSTASLADDYEAALADLGPWTPVGEPNEARMENGWAFRQGVGVATLEGVDYTALTAVARHGDRRARFWAFADSDDTFNRYQAVLGNAIGSVQELTLGGAGGSAPQAAAALASAGSGLPPGFGQGLSGVYAGLERGLAASTGIGGSEIADAMEVEVLFPDGTYRRRLPLRGLGGDLGWERAQQALYWGRWSRQGDRVVLERDGYTTSYRIAGADLVSDRDRLWKKLPASGGERLEGSFARADLRDADAPRLILRADGSYEDRSGFLRMIGGPWHLVVPDGETLIASWSQGEADRALGPGSGSYRFEAFTLTLDDRDGRRWQINAYLPPGESAPSPRRLVINGRQLARD